MLWWYLFGQICTAVLPKICAAIDKIISIFLQRDKIHPLFYLVVLQRFICNPSFTN